MGTNYYRIPKASEVEEKKERLKAQIDAMPTAPCDVKRAFRYINDPEDEWNPLNPWDEFIEDISIHLGKRSSGWKFCWNFHNNKYYSNKKELIDFINAGRVVDEYGEEIQPKEFMDMAFNWEEPNGLVVDADYFRKNPSPYEDNPERYYDREVDGLRVSNSIFFS